MKHLAGSDKAIEKQCCLQVSGRCVSKDSRIRVISMIPDSMDVGGCLKKSITSYMTYFYPISSSPRSSSSRCASPCC